MATSLGKYCNTCKQWKPFGDFNQHSMTRDGYTVNCRSCIEQSRAERKKHARGTPVEVFRICKVCGEPKNPSAFKKGHHKCKECQQKDAAVRKTTAPRKKKHTAAIGSVVTESGKIVPISKANKLGWW